MTSAIIQILVANAGVQSVVGLNKAGTKYKVYPVRADQDEIQPYITVFKGQNDPILATSKDEVSQLDYPRITISCWAIEFRDTELMFEAVRNALDNDSSTFGSYNIQRLWIVDDRDGWDPESKLYVHVAVYGVEQKR